MKQKVLITGATGFAGSHLAELLVQDNQFEVAGTHISDKHLNNIEQIRDKIELHKVDLQNAIETKKIIAQVKPDVIFHLAASTSVFESFDKPIEVITNNISAQINVLEAVKEQKLLGTKILITSSAHVYGYVSPDDLPITEQTQFRPDNPYSVSKITQDYLGYSYFMAYSQHIIRLRPFNHIGPRQSPDLSISRWSKVIADLEKGNKEPILKVGNLSTFRDFTDVRDMVKAYVLAAKHCKDGEAYNIGSGTSYSMQKMLDILLSYSKVSIKVEIDQSLLRPSDIPKLEADSSKFRKATGWEPEIPIEKTLQDTLDYWRKVI